jgi:hypothetical protein
MKYTSANHLNNGDKETRFSWPEGYYFKTKITSVGTQKWPDANKNGMIQVGNEFPDEFALFMETNKQSFRWSEQEEAIHLYKKMSLDTVLMTEK